MCRPADLYATILWHYVGSYAPSITNNTLMPTHHLLSRSWLIKHSFALVIFSTMIGLAFWQVARLEDRRATNAARLAALEQPALPLINADSIDPTTLVGRKVRLVGTWLNEESVVLRGRRSASGVDGVHLLTPLRLRGSDQALLVDRGWLPASQQSPESLAAYAVSREVTLEGIARLGQSRPATLLAPYDLPLPGETTIHAWIRADIAAIQAQVSAPLLPIYVEALPAPGDAPLPRPFDPRLQDEGPHQGYALQWLSFAILLAIVYTILIRQELGRKPA